MEHHSEISFRPSIDSTWEKMVINSAHLTDEKKQTSTILTNDGMPRSFQVKKTCLYVMIVKSYLKIWVHFLALGSIFLLTLHCDNSFRIPADIFKNWWWHKMFLKNIYIYIYHFAGCSFQQNKPLFWIIGPLFLFLELFKSYFNFQWSTWTIKNAQ